jgi:hypothetical protein
VHLFDNGQRKETRGECISQLCDWALYLLTMYLSIIPCKHVGVCSAVYILPLWDVAHQGVYHRPDYQMSLVDWTLC